MQRRATVQITQLS